MAQTMGEILQGGEGDDTLRGTADMDVISAIAGDNLLVGLGAGDALVTGTGADILRGGSGDDLLVIDPDDPIINGGLGIDTAILSPSEVPYTFTTANLAGIEAIQDAPGQGTTILFDARILESVDDDSFLFAMGDGVDEVRITNFGDTVDVQGDQVVFDGNVVLEFEGVESLVLVGGDGTSSSVISQTLTPSGIGSSTTVQSLNGLGTSSTTITSVTTTGPVSDDAEAQAPEAVAGPGSAAFLLAEALFGEDAPEGIADLSAMSDQVFEWLEQHAEAADALRDEDAGAAAEAEVQDIGSLFGTDGLFGLLSSDSLLRWGTESDLFSVN